MVRPRKTGANAVPSSWLERLKSEMKTVSNWARIANDTEVVIKARQLARNSRFLLIVSMSLGFRSTKNYFLICQQQVYFMFV